MKNIFYKLILSFAFLAFLNAKAIAQVFLATAEKDGMDVVVKVTPNGGDITAQFIDIEFFLRNPSTDGPFNFGAVTVNTIDFPSVLIPYNGVNQQGTEAGYSNYWFGTSFSATPSSTYTNGVEYEVFRVALTVDPATLNLELVHNAGFVPTYITMTDGSGMERANHGAPYYGTGTGSCSDCPAGSGLNQFVPVQTVIVPVELVSFDVKKKGADNANISWTTASEINTSHFEVERSFDGAYWEAVGEVTASGNSFATSNYTLEDNNLKRFISSDQFVYYRLKSVDYDRSFEFSAVRNIEVKFEGVAIQVYPNPTTDGVYVNVNMPDRNDELTAIVKDIQGRTLEVINLGNDKLINEYVNLNQLSAGTYFISVQGSDKIYGTERIVITTK